MVEKQKYKRKLSNMLNYSVLCEYQMLIHTKVGIFMCWNGRERIESKETQGTRKGKTGRNIRDQKDDKKSEKRG